MIRRYSAMTAVFILLLVGACSRDLPPTGPTADAGGSPGKNGTEALGPPDIEIASGTRFAQAGVGMVGTSSGDLHLEVPVNLDIAQVLLYWAGGSTSGTGDDTIELDGVPVAGTLIGGPTPFFTIGGLSYDFTAYRADITDLGLVRPGTNDLVVGGFDFVGDGGVDENNGCSIVVILDGGGVADLGLVDGLDMAYFGFDPTLDATVPQTFAVTASDVPRTADLLLLVASVGEDRPNRIKLTTSDGVEIIDNALSSNAGPTWDSLLLPVTVPAGDAEITVELISLDTVDPQGASLGWVAAGLSLAATPPTDVQIGGTVFVDADRDGAQGEFEGGIANVVLDVFGPDGLAATAVTGEDGTWVFEGPPGDYTVQIDPSAYPGTFNEDLAANFAATTPLSVIVSGAATGIDFGFVPDPDAILADLDVGELISVAQPREYWAKVIRQAYLDEQALISLLGLVPSGGTAVGRDRGEDYLDADEIRALLRDLMALYLPEPYKLEEGNLLRQAYDILAATPDGIEEELYQELFVTELNFVAASGLADESDRLGVLISWGETLLATPFIDDPAAKGYIADLQGALRVFDAINTGGGAGIDE